MVLLCPSTRAGFDNNQQLYSPLNHWENEWHANLEASMCYLLVNSLQEGELNLQIFQLLLQRNPG